MGFCLQWLDGFLFFIIFLRWWFPFLCAAKATGRCFGLPASTPDEKRDVRTAWSRHGPGTRASNPTQWISSAKKCAAVPSISHLSLSSLSLGQTKGGWGVKVCLLFLLPLTPDGTALAHQAEWGRLHSWHGQEEMMRRVSVLTQLGTLRPSFSGAAQV